MAHVERRLAAPQVTPDGYTHGSGIALEETPLEMLVAGFGRYIEVGGQAGPLDDELTCDWFAALAIAGVATSFLTNPDHMPVQPGSWRKAADGIFLVTRLVRLLGFLSGIRHFARGVTGGAAHYWQERYQVELSIRLNVMSNLAAGFNEIVLAQLEFAEGSGFPHHVEKAQIIAAFNAALARDARLFHDRIFRLFDVLEPARDPVRLEADLACGHTSGLLDDPRRAADELRAQLERQIAIG